MGWENPSLAVTVCHHPASLVMPMGDPRDGFLYPTLTLMMDSYIMLKMFVYFDASYLFFVKSASFEG